jgi:uncharacterized protein YbjT (DUF2867 family)
MKVTVFGATGQLGRVTVPQLVAAGHDVVAVVRRDEQLAVVAEQGATGVLGDLEGGEHGDLGPALAGAEAVVWVAGANYLTGPEHSDRVDRDGALRAIETARAAGVGRWIQVSSLYANRVEAGPPPLQHFLTNKKAADDALKTSGIGWTVMRPGGLLNDEPTGTVKVAPVLGSGGITRADVAAFIVELLRTGRGIDTEFDMGNDDSTKPTTIAEAVATL